MKEVYIAPSILAADFSQLGVDIQKVEAEADFLHLDVMDGHYVPNISFGVPVISSIRSKSKLAFDVHLMIENPEKYIASFAEAGADLITFHLETTCEPEQLCQKIRDLGKKPGISIHPDTPIEAVYPHLSNADLILVMSVRPGFGGQSFMEEAPGRVSQIRNELDRIGSKALLSVDGGIGEKTAPVVLSAGANMLVAGSSVFGTSSPSAAIRQIRQVCRLSERI